MSQSGDDPNKVLPLREYPKIGKFMRLLIILMLQVNSKIVCNSDQMQAALTRLLRAVSDMFLVQEPVPYDQINLSLDVMQRHISPFKSNH